MTSLIFLSMAKKYICGELFWTDNIVIIFDIVHTCLGVYILKNSLFRDVPLAYIFIAINIAINVLWKVLVFIRIVYFAQKDDHNTNDPLNNVELDSASADSRIKLGLSRMRTIICVCMTVYGIVTLALSSISLNEKNPTNIFLIFSFCYEVAKNMLWYITKIIYIIDIYS